MTILALEIHDAGIRWVNASGIGDASPGYALWEGGAIVAGRAALRRAREKPRFINHQFWQDLDTEPLGKPFPHALSAADLAHAHLSEVWKAVPEGTDRVILTVPGSFSARQLGLILGIARACGLPVAGLVDAAAAATPVAAAAAGHPGRRLLHLDLHLHRVALTELEISDPPSHLPSGGTGDARERWATVIRRRVRLGDSGGLVALQNAWARRIAELFVHATRYDPLHSAAAEQALYSRLPEWLEALHSNELIEAALGPEGRERTVELTRPDLVDAADTFYENLPEMVLALKRGGENITLLLARGLAELPGLESRLTELRGVTTVPLPAGAAASGALLTQDQILDETDSDSDQASPRRRANGTQGLPLVTRLSFEAPAAAIDPQGTARAVQAPQPAQRRPSHLVHQGLAYPLTERPLRLGLALDGEPGLELEGSTAGISRLHCTVVRQGATVMVEDHSTYGSFVNDERIEGRATLEVGDRLRLGTPGIELALIAVVETSRLHPSGDSSRLHPSGDSSRLHPSGDSSRLHPSGVT